MPGIPYNTTVFENFYVCSNCILRTISIINWLINLINQLSWIMFAPLTIVPIHRTYCRTWRHESSAKVGMLESNFRCVIKLDYSSHHRQTIALLVQQLQQSPFNPWKCTALCSAKRSTCIILSLRLCVSAEIKNASSSSLDRIGSIFGRRYTIRLSTKPKVAFRFLI